VAYHELVSHLLTNKLVSAMVEPSESQNMIVNFSDLLPHISSCSTRGLAATSVCQGLPQVSGRGLKRWSIGVHGRSHDQYHKVTRRDKLRGLYNINRPNRYASACSPPLPCLPTALRSPSLPIGGVTHPKVLVANTNEVLSHCIPMHT
jgi:hypothetical protein